MSKIAEITTGPGGALLASDEPPAFEIVNPDGAAPFLLICDHASALVPRALGGLGLDEAVRTRHIGWDIGAAELARRLSARFDAPLILSGYSRLVIDCNREFDDPTSIPIVSDGVEIPGNRAIGAAQAAARQRLFFAPYHDAIEARIARFRGAGHAPAVISMHSMTPVFEGQERPWEVCVLWNQDPRVAVPFLENLHGDGGIAVGDNQPYSGREDYGYSIRHHAEDPGLPHILIEVRQDLIDTNHGAAHWSERVARSLGPALIEKRSIYRAGGYHPQGHGR
ncbi:MAG: N-formylglutamate amidohydrolase [Alphaproteobacteria bacterium]